jgi:predicted nucleotidyltransferase
MKSLQDILKKKENKKIKFKITKTQHLLIKAKINGVSGNFILDTGASNSCVDLKALSYSCSQQKRLRQKPGGEPQECLHKLHQIISYNLNLERFIIRFSDFDLSHVNEALIQHKSKPVHGIIERTYY